MLYEPTNIIPSTMTQTGTVAATTDNVNIQWQVNGNSAMTMFQIDVMQNNADSTFVYSTGIVTENPTVAQGYSLPFYGKDRFGDYVQFVYQPNQTWAAWSGNAISDGNSYKFRITQFFQENGTACKVPITSNLSAGTTYYFSYSVNGATQYVSFTVANASYFVGGNTIYFNFSHSAGWVTTSGTNVRAITDITFSVSDIQPSGTQLSGAVAVSSGDMFYNQFFTAQNSASSFITRTEPTLTITPLAETPVASATQNFTAIYSQEQGDSINTVRWQLFNAEDMYAPIDDTGEISTSVLSYEYNGLFDGQSYSVVCTVTTESGVTVSATLNFSVQYEQGTYTGDFTAQSLCHEDANLLKWDGISAIPGVDEPSGSATVSNGQLVLSENSTVTWSKKTDVNGEVGELNFPAPWTVVWSGEIAQVSMNYIANLRNTFGNDAQNNYSYWCIFCSDSSMLACCNYIFFYTFTGEAIESYFRETYFGYYRAITNPSNSILLTFRGSTTNVYTINPDGLTFMSQLQVPNYILNSHGGAFNSDGSLCVSGGCIFSVNESDFTYSYWMEGTHSEAGQSIGLPGDFIFSPKDDFILRFGENVNFNIDNQYPFSTNSPCYIYSIGDSVSGSKKLSEINSDTNVATFNKSGELLITGGNSGCFVYSVNGETVQILYELKSNGNSIINCTCIKLSNNGTVLLIASMPENYTESRIDIYSVSGNDITWITNINNNSVSFDGIVYDATFNPSDSICIVSGTFTDRAYEFNTGVDGIISENIFQINNDFHLRRYGQKIEVTDNNNDILSTSYILGNEGNGANSITVCLSPTNLRVYSFVDSQYLGMDDDAIDYTQQPISSAQLQGKQTCNYFTIIDGDGSNIAGNLTDYTWKPEWDSDDYTVDLLANFNYGIDGGTATQTGIGFRIYRRKADGTENIELVTLPSTTLSLRDYGIKSNESYIYDFYVYDANGAFMGVRSTEATPLKRQFKRFSLLSTQYNESDNSYHVIKEFQFSCNIQDMSVSNNSNKSYVQNFTPYPTVFQSTANYASGTLQALIGFVDPKAYKYWDSTQLMDELNALSTTTNTLFLKDMKGHLWMVDVGTVQMTATQKTREMQVTISLPWTEIGDASNVSIIQTPDDEGWDYGEQVLDVKLDVDVNTGLLYVTYPFPYNGTAFYLVGTNPVGSENIVQPLSETASSPQDGILKAKVKS